jgi:hypothetical protein
MKPILFTIFVCSFFFNHHIQTNDSVNYKNIQGVYDYQMNKIENYIFLFNESSKIMVLEGHCIDCLLKIARLINENMNSENNKILVCIRANTVFDFKYIIRNFINKNSNLYFIQIKEFDHFFTPDKQL